MYKSKTIAEVERALEAIIKKHTLAPDVSVASIRKLVANDTDGDAKRASSQFTNAVLKHLEHVSDMNELNEALQVFMDAWNHFPHPVLGGKSPVEMMQEVKASGEEPEYMSNFSPPEIFGELYRLARERGKREHALLDGTPNEFARIENVIAGIKTVGDQRNASTFVTMHGLKLLGRIHAKMPETIEPFMREAQAMLNHRFINTEEATGSPLLWCAMDTLTNDGTRQLPAFDVPCFMTTLVEAHRAIDQIGEKYDFEIRAVSVAHHVLDWLAMETPRRFENKEARALVALAYGIVGRVHDAVTGCESPTGTFEKLARLGGWRTRSAFVSALSTAFFDVMYAVQDPHMLIVDAEHTPDDWFLRLKNIAPALDDHFADVGRPPEGSIPSPWGNG
ncbi:MAG: hypothetical protein AAB794_00385 [Patescibacteria group bacterium]